MKAQHEKHKAHIHEWRYHEIRAKPGWKIIGWPANVGSGITLIS